jgi:hypothetical protein
MRKISLGATKVLPKPKPLHPLLREAVASCHEGPDSGANDASPYHPDCHALASHSLCTRCNDVAGEAAPSSQPPRRDDNDKRVPGTQHSRWSRMSLATYHQLSVVGLGRATPLRLPVEPK